MPWKRKKKSANYTPAELRDCNDLTRLSPIPGQLHYETYMHYLALIGHVQPHQRLRLGVPQEPQNSILQTQEEAQCSAQEDSKAADGVSLNNERGFFTSWRADQALWSEQSLPEILYCFDRPELWLAPKDLREPPLKSYQVNGIQLRDIPILPDHVSSDLEGWRHVAWTRMDPRISSKDITDRMGTQSMSSASRRSRKQLRGQNSTIQMRTARFREDFPALGWVKKGGNFEKDRRKLKARLEAAGVPTSRNTTRGVSWGLVDTAKGESGGRIPVAEKKTWPSSVGQQPEVVPTLPTSLPTAATEPLLVFTDHTLHPSPQAPSTRSDSQHSRALTPEHYFKMSIASSFRGKTIKQESPSSSDTIIMETPRKRRKTIKFEEANNDLRPISEMPLYVPQQPVRVSNKDPYRAAYVRSLEIRNRFETRPEIKRQQREIPHDVRMSSQHPDTGTNIPRLASQEAFVRQLRHLSTRSAAKNATNTQLVHIGPTTYGNDEITTVEYGESTLTLKNYYQRYYLSKEARTLLTTFHPAGSEGRNRQLEYLLDPSRAAYGFQDCNGYEAPIAGVNLARELEYNIWYQVTQEEASGRLKTSAVQVPTAQDNNNHMKSPGVVMYFDGSMRLFDDLRGVPLVWGEVGRARRIVSSMNHPNEGHFDAVGGLRIL